MIKNEGTIVQILGPVVDVRFQEGKLPKLLNALIVDFEGKDILLKWLSILVMKLQEPLQCAMLMVCKEV